VIDLMQQPMRVMSCWLIWSAGGTECRQGAGGQRSCHTRCQYGWRDVGCTGCNVAVHQLNLFWTRHCQGNLSPW